MWKGEPADLVYLPVVDRILYLQNVYKQVNKQKYSEAINCESNNDDNNNDDDNNNRIERLSLRFVQSPHCATNCLQHVRSSGAIVYKSCATHGALITCNMLCTTWCIGTAQLLSLTEFNSSFILALFY